MNPQLTQEKLKEALKHLLKRRGATYKDVAEVWECSVPTVKRMLGKEELPLSRLLTLLDWLDINLSELEKLAESETTKVPEFTGRQAEFLMKNPHFLAFLNELYEGALPREIAKRHSLSSGALDTYLRRLETYDLIRVTGKGKVKLPSPELPRLNQELGEAHYRQIIDRAASYFKNKIGNLLAATHHQRAKKGKTSFALTTVKVTQKTYEEYFERQVKLESDLKKVSHLEEQQYDPANLKVYVMLSGHHLDEIGSPELEQLNPFGEVSSNP